MEPFPARSIVAGASALSAFKQRQLLTRLSAVAAISALIFNRRYLFDEPLSDKALPVALGHQRWCIV